ncbi:DNA cytosine methyltransferase [Aeromonas caviae]|uniref:DNA cytosine methyltransferase n=1 Tax=Aeromonas caviae TaxID=648 RepID=UPI0021C945E2|nr:DNA cytosine methyltransferase [Aeromonas caviae]MCR9024536.1 DNA cytosine methyltransferase [Aeromonas caviae]
MSKFVVQHDKPTCIELFAGAGGLMLGLEMAGFSTLVATEVHPDPCKTLQRNFPEVPVVCKDIRELSGKDLLEAAGKELGCEIDLIAGGPPCQGFSNAGLKDPDDPRNTLIGEFIRIVEEVRPRFFLMENVEGLKNLHQGKLFNKVLERFQKTGYTITWKVLFAADYGVPQMRKRLFIVGSRDNERFEFPSPTHFSYDDIQKGLFESPKKPYVTVGDALGDIPPINQGEITDRYEKGPKTEYEKLMREGAVRIYNHQASKHKKETMEYYSLLPPGGIWQDIPEHLRKKKQGMQRWPLDGLSRTITTEPTDFIHPVLHRIPTIRELARIQSFPDNYEFLGQRTTGNKMRRLGYCAQSQQVGNAVPPLLAKAVGTAIFNLLKSAKSIEVKKTA